MRYLLLLFVLAGLLSCDGELPEHMAISDIEKEKFKALQNPFAKRFYAFGSEPEQVAIGMHDCTLFRAVKYRGAVIEWQKLFKPAWYPFSYCQRQSITQVDEYTEVFAGKIAAGAGGCCATAMHYRSKDGLIWQKIENGVWRDVEISVEPEPEPEPASIPAPAVKV